MSTGDYCLTCRNYPIACNCYKFNSAEASQKTMASQVITNTATNDQNLIEPRLSKSQKVIAEVGGRLLVQVREGGDKVQKRKKKRNMQKASRKKNR